MLMPEKSLTDHALDLANQKWGQPQPLSDHLAGLQTTEAPDVVSRSWYILQCEPQRERTAAAHLIGRRFKVYLPTETKRQTRRGRKIEVTRPLFPGYLFARLNWLADASRIRFIHNTPGIRAGVHSFLMYLDAPATIPDRVMEAVEQMAQEFVRPKKPAASFTVGQQVQVTEGPFTGFLAEVETILKLEPEERITALIELFGQQTRIHFDADQLRSL